MVKTSFGRFCNLLGIEYCSPGGEDSRDNLTGEEQCAALRLWGIDCADRQKETAALGRLRQDRWFRLIEPYLVVAVQAASIQVEIHLPEHLAGGRLRWVFSEEHGPTASGEILLGELSKGEERQFDQVSYLALVFQLDHRRPEPGYHRLELLIGDEHHGWVRGKSTVIVTPENCYLPPGLHGDARLWGISCELASVRSRRNWGIGDLTDLKNLLGWAAANGAASVAVSSLHYRSLFGERPDPLSPPSALRFFDPVYLDLQAVADFQECEEVANLVNEPAFQMHLTTLAEGAGVSRSQVVAVKTGIAKKLWHHFQESHLEPETGRGRHFRDFQEAGGASLAAFALYAALVDVYQAAEAGEEKRPVSRRTLPAVDSPEAADFAASHHQLLEYHCYLQWQLELQLAEVGQRSLELGLKIGLIQTLPVAMEPDGFTCWFQGSLFAQLYHGGRACRGAESVSPKAQPLSASAYESLIELLRVNMRYAGALRFSSAANYQELNRPKHNMSGGATALGMRLTPEVAGIIALESLRNRCQVICEDPGNLPPSLAETVHAMKFFTSMPGGFARNPQGAWLPASAHPEQAVVMAGWDDCCSLAAFWQGRDIGLLAARSPGSLTEVRESLIIARAADRAQLLVALSHEGLLPEGYDIDPATIPAMTPELVRAVHTFLLRSPAKIFLLNLADLQLPDRGGSPQTEEPPVLAGTGEPVGLDELFADEELPHLFWVFCQERAIGVIRPSAKLVDRQRRQGYSIPRCFYRLQFNSSFTFAHAAALVPYLRELGVSHCYASPCLKARPGSSHGYDIIDHASLNPEIGTRQEYEEFVAALDHNGMAQIVDMVPHHMGVGADNAWWVDVLENGQASAFAHFFDINWQTTGGELENRILLPVLGDYFGAVLEQGDLQLMFQADRGRFLIGYYEHLYPVAPETYPVILGHDLARLEARLGGEHEGFLELQSLIASLSTLPGRQETAAEPVAMRRRNKEVLKRLLARLCRENTEIAWFISENVVYFNGEPGRPESFDALEKLLARQAFRLAFWRVASDEINYRRFFDINDLAGICVERQDVFDQTHSLVLDLIATGKIDGLRIDHPDGLYDPKRYFATVQAAVSGTPPGAAAPDNPLPLYMVVEKILAEEEELPGDWLVHGTTGYDFSCLVNGLFIDRAAEQEITAGYHQFIGSQVDFPQLVHDCKRLIIRTAMAGEINVLSEYLHRLAKKSRYTQDYTLNSLREALTEIVAYFPVYRTYFTGEASSGSGRRSIELAVELAKGRHQAEETSIYSYIKSVLLLEGFGSQASLAGEKQPEVDFVMKLQQYTGPVMAKGVEDTAFYRANRLLSLNEVGGGLCRFGVSVDEFHARNQARRQLWPQAMLNTSTHDSKRSEDVRARINVLSEMPAEWNTALRRWHHLSRVGGGEVEEPRSWPSKNDEYALYQNLLGVWPLAEMSSEEGEDLRQRFTSVMLKMVREAKVHTSWLHQNQAYEEGVSDFVAGLLENRQFLDDFTAFHKKTSWFGMLNSLGQLLLKLTSPGIPDIYQGNEIWTFSLVDPDNRRPVDFARRRSMLGELQQAMGATGPTAETLDQLFHPPDDGRVKMYVLWRVLAFRRENPGLFAQGEYLPLQVSGSGQEHICAFARRYGEKVLIVAVPRLVARLVRHQVGRLPLGEEIWGDTRLHLPEVLQSLEYTNLLTGKNSLSPQGRVGFLGGELFDLFPLALLANQHGQA
jgi:(1->4)-alpha-D-glucan 1-alpha-D-glucosylmutase